MPSKKPPVTPSTAAKAPSRPDNRPNPASAHNPLKQANNRWQRTKRYGWDSR